jgi:retron-type reverse transcriptase
VEARDEHGVQLDRGRRSAEVFDTIDHGHLREFLKRRVRDGVILRLIGKWLNAGVLEDETLTASETGTPQGGG